VPVGLELEGWVGERKNGGAEGGDVAGRALRIAGVGNECGGEGGGVVGGVEPGSVSAEVAGAGAGELAVNGENGEDW